MQDVHLQLLERFSRIFLAILLCHSPYNFNFSQLGMVWRSKNDPVAMLLRYFPYTVRWRRPVLLNEVVQYHFCVGFRNCDAICTEPVQQFLLWPVRARWLLGVPFVVASSIQLYVTWPMVLGSIFAEKFKPQLKHFCIKVSMLVTKWVIRIHRFPLFAFVLPPFEDG